MYCMRQNSDLLNQLAKQYFLVAALVLASRSDGEEDSGDEESAEEQTEEEQKEDSDASEGSTRGGMIEVDPARTQVVDPARTRSVDPART